jgi:hypothetical protein
MFLGGCLPPPPYYVNTNGFSAGPQQQMGPGASVHVLRNAEAANPMLEEEVSRKFEHLLRSKGFAIASFDQADLVVVTSYGIGSGQQVGVAQPVFVPGGRTTIKNPTGGTVATVNTPGTLNYVPTTRTEYERWLVISVADGRHGRATGEVKLMWQGETTSSGSNADLREVLNVLLLATVDEFGRNTGRAVRRTISEGNPQVQELLRQ